MNEEISRARIERTWNAVREQGLDAFYVRDTSNIAWLTAFDDVFDDERAHAVLMDADGDQLHTDSRYSGACRAAARPESGIGMWHIDDARQTHAKWLAEVLDPDAKLLGIEDDMPLSEYRQLQQAFGANPAEGAHAEGDSAAAGEAFAPAGTVPELVETSDFVVGLRGVKDADEVRRLKAAQAITDAAFSYIVGFMKPDMTEREVQVELEDFMYRHGSRGLAFSSIVASGANGASPHAIPGEKKLQAGECVVMDFGARALGYCSDMTRTVFIGEPDQRLRSAYTVLREANETVEAMLRPGITGAEAHNRAEEVLAEGGFAGKMGHALGHGVGIDIHELPVLAPRNKKPLVAGNVVTVEPGIYLEGEFGMRLEDFGIVTENGYEVFTQSTHDMVII